MLAWAGQCQQWPTDTHLHAEIVNHSSLLQKGNNLKYKLKTSLLPLSCYFNSVVYIPVQRKPDASFWNRPTQNPANTQEHFFFPTAHLVLLSLWDHWSPKEYNSRVQRGQILSRQEQVELSRAGLAQSGHSKVISILGNTPIVWVFTLREQMPQVSCNSLWGLQLLSSSWVY